jgi:hypothetical protein
MAEYSAKFRTGIAGRPNGNSAKPACQPVHDRGCRAERSARASTNPDGHGSVAEWFKALVLKTSVRGTVPWVRIPPLPPITIDLYSKISISLRYSHNRSPMAARLGTFDLLRMLCLGSRCPQPPPPDKNRSSYGQPHPPGTQPSAFMVPRRHRYTIPDERSALCCLLHWRHGAGPIPLR